MEGEQKREPGKDARTESGGRYILDDSIFRNHTKAQTIKRWKRNLKKKARSERRRVKHKAMSK